MLFPHNQQLLSPKSTFFTIQPFPSYEPEAEDPFEAHAHKHFQLLWIEKGRGRLLVDTVSQQIEGSAICLVKPEQMHQLTGQENLQGYLISFTETILQRGETEFSFFYHTRHLRAFEKALALSDETNATLKDLIQKMNNENLPALPYGEDLLRRYFKIFLLYVFREFERMKHPETAPRTSQVVQHYLQLINEQFLEKKAVTDYAAQLSVTPNYLNDVTKQITGYTAGHHIRQRVLVEIQRKMMYSAANMKEIAYSLGFIDPAHFSKYFKSLTGMGFLEYRSTLKLAARSAIES